MWAAQNTVPAVKVQDNLVYPLPMVNSTEAHIVVIHLHKWEISATIQYIAEKILGICMVALLNWLH